MPFRKVIKAIRYLHSAKKLKKIFYKSRSFIGITPSHYVKSSQLRREFISTVNVFFFSTVSQEANMRSIP